MNKLDQTIQHMLDSIPRLRDYIHVFVHILYLSSGLLQFRGEVMLIFVVRSCKVFVFPHHTLLSVSAPPGTL